MFPSHAQIVLIADGVRPVASNLRNVVDACDRLARWYTAQPPEVQAEAVKICAVERFLQIRTAAQSLRDEMTANLLAYEGEPDLPERVAE